MNPVGSTLWQHPRILALVLVVVLPESVIVSRKNVKLVDMIDAFSEVCATRTARSDPP